MNHRYYETSNLNAPYDYYPPMRGVGGVLDNQGAAGAWVLQNQATLERLGQKPESSLPDWRPFINDLVALEDAAVPLLDSAGPYKGQVENFFQKTKAVKSRVNLELAVAAVAGLLVGAGVTYLLTRKR